MIAIAVAVALPYVNPAFQGFWGGIGAAVVGSATSQAVGLATGIQNKFDFKGLALSALSAGVTGGLAKLGAFEVGSKFAAGALRGATSGIITQGVGVATGLQDRFSWSGVAAAGVGGGITQQIGGSNMWGRAGASLAGGLGGAAAASLVSGQDFGDTLISSLPSIIANTIGNLVAGAVADSGKPKAGEIVVNEKAVRAAGDRLLAQQSNALYGQFDLDAPLSLGDGTAANVTAATGTLSAASSYEPSVGSPTANLEEGPPIYVYASRETQAALRNLSNDQFNFLETLSRAAGWSAGQESRFAVGFARSGMSNLNQYALWHGPKLLNLTSNPWTGVIEPARGPLISGAAFNGDSSGNMDIIHAGTNSNPALFNGSSVVGYVGNAHELIVLKAESLQGVKGGGLAALKGISHGLAATSVALDIVDQVKSGKPVDSAVANAGGRYATYATIGAFAAPETLGGSALLMGGVAAIDYTVGDKIGSAFEYVYTKAKNQF